MIRIKKLARFTLFTTSLAVGAASLGACGDDDEEGDGNGSEDDGEGSGGQTSVIVLGTGSDSGTGSGTGTGTGSGNGNGDAGGAGNVNFVGGTKVLDEDEIKSLTGDACDGGKYEGEVLPSVIQLVIDVSSSMRSTAPGTDLSKWEVTRDLLLEGIVGVEGNGLPASVGVGLLFYPNRPDVESTVEPQELTACVNTDAFVAPEVLGNGSAAHRMLVGSSIQDAVTEQWTPTHDAFRYALREGLLQKEVSGHKFMLLITDGTPTFSLGCTQQEGENGGVDPEPIVDEVAYAASQGVRTFLIGSPGSEANREWMSRAAVIGGSAPEGCSINGPVGDYCHMDMTAADDFTEALREGLARIAGVISTCSYEIPEEPTGKTFSEDEVNVLLKRPDGSTVLIYRDDTGDCTEGWSYDDKGQIELCEDTCSEIQLENKTTVEIVVGCESSTVIR